MSKKTNNHIDPEEARFLEDQLYQAQFSLFTARSVKQVKFLQNRIDFLRQKVREMNGKKHG